MAAENNKLRNYLDDSAIQQLLTVNYSSSEVAPNTSITLTFRDEINVDGYDDDGIRCKISRKLTSNPDTLSIEITVRITLKVKQEFYGKVPWDDFDVSAEIVTSEYQNYFADPMSRLSLLISNLTASFSGTPIITPTSLFVGDLPAV